MNVLVLCSAYPNYVPDLLLHGMRKLLGDSAVDYPRKDVLYDGICGQPNLDRVAGLMPDDGQVDRDDIAHKVANGFFDLVLVDIRAFNDNIVLLQQNRSPLALIDGEDHPARIAPGPFVILRRETSGNDNAIPLPMALPTEVMDWIDRHAAAEKTHSIGFLGSRSRMTPDRNIMLDELARIFPDGLIASWDVSAEPKGRDEYYRSLQSCKLLLTLPGAGYDTFRYWENAACNAAHVAKRMPLFIENDFRDQREILRFDGLYELAGAVETLLQDEGRCQELAALSRERLGLFHTTERRAQQTIDNLKRAFLLS